MAVEIFVSPAEVFKFYSDNLDRMTRENVEIARNTDTDYAVCLTEKDGYPTFTVFRGEKEVYNESCISEDDSSKTLKHLYITYLFPVVCSEEDYPLSDEDWYKSSRQRKDDEIYERADELELAAGDFLAVLLDCNPDEISALYGKEFIATVLDSLCTYLADEHLISVYRPMWIINPEDGEELFSEFPYLDIQEPIDDIPPEEYQP